MTLLENIALNATKDILEKNLSLKNPEILGKKIVLVYDTDSELSTLISAGYIENLKEYSNVEIILFQEEKGSELKDKLLWLEANSTVILVQSTNFRLESFRIRISLQQKNVGCIEHNHLSYIKSSQTKTYLEAISYQSDYFETVSNFLKQTFDAGNTLKVIWSNGSEFEISWGFEDMKQNTGNFSLDNRYATYPIWENFTEAKDFSNVNGELYVKAFPWEDLQVVFAEKPFKITVKNSIITYKKEDIPKELLPTFEKIEEAEWEIMMRELGFWLNKAITFENTLSDVNAFERMAWFHLSLGKKHGVYRKKMSKDIVQRYHIDIFPDVEKIFVDDKLIFEKGKHFVYE